MFDPYHYHCSHGSPLDTAVWLCAQTQTSPSFTLTPQQSHSVLSSLAYAMGYAAVAPTVSLSHLLTLTAMTTETATTAAATATTGTAGTAMGTAMG